MTDENPKKEYDPPDLAAFVAQSPLYESIQLRVTPVNEVHGVGHVLPNTMPTLSALLYPAFRVDAYCPACARETVYAGTAATAEDQANIVKLFVRNTARYFQINMTCSRSEHHHLVVGVRVVLPAYGDRIHIHHRFVIVTKIGMWPSLADLQQPLGARLAKAAGKKGVSEFKRGIGLAAHGIGIGAFVYLRRIFEDLIDEVASAALDSGEVDKDDYYRSRMDDKIGLLKARLPEFMVKNKQWYAIVSKGIHELDEQECLKYFDVVRTGIEIILDQKAETLERADREREASSAINKINTELNKPDSV